jgi:hypothetical protein
VTGEVHPFRDFNGSTVRLLLTGSKSVCPEWHLVKGVFRGIFTPTKRSAVPRSLEKVDAEAKVLRMG